MKRVIGFFFSMPFKMALIAVLAVAVGTATFIERDHGARAARAAVYGAAWFEALFVMIALNLAGNLVRAKLWRRKKVLALGFHLAFLMILVGAGITRHFGRSGTLHFREGETAGAMLSDGMFLSVRVSLGEDSFQAEWPLAGGQGSVTRFSKTVRVGEQEVRLRCVGFVASSEKSVVEDPDGVPVAVLMVADGEGASEAVIAKGDTLSVSGIRFGFDAGVAEPPWVRLGHGPKGLEMVSSEPVQTVSMRARGRRTFRPGKQFPIEDGTLVSLGGTQFALRRFHATARITAKPATRTGMGTGEESMPEALEIEVETGGRIRRVSCFGVEGERGAWQRVFAGDPDLSVSYGAKSIPLPFRLRLDDFTVERYPGSMRPSGFRSDVTLIDPDRTQDTPYAIYMNHILKHRGYRLYQASFDPDEKGSVLSVSRDPGTPVTYAGYLVMGALLLGAFLHRGSRFRTLAMELTKKPGKPVHAAMLAAMLYAGIAAQAIAGPGSATTNRDHCLRFSELLVQDKNGRIKPFHSLAAQSLQQTGHPEKGMGLSMEQVSWMLLFSADSAGWSEGFRGAAAALRRSFKPYPVPGDPGKRWVNEPSALEGPDSSAVQLLVSGYRTAVLGKDWTSANAWLDSLGSYQIRHAAAILPSRLKQRAELAYNRLDLFHRLGWIVLLFGAALLAAAAAEARMSSGSLSAVRRVLVFLVSIAFAAFLAGLALRWFVSGHAPWTNKYESMVFIAWAALLAGILSGRFGAFALALGSIGSGLMLRLAHSGNTDPAIGTLAPVLKSKWLVIHVSVITASYGFFLLGGLIALCILLMLAAAPRRSDAGLGGTVRRMSQVQEWTLLAGLLLVMLGNVFGAVWANESWGRYWGWDPKETWTLIVIIAYTAALHVRLIRPLNRPYWLSVFSIAGIACVTMTYWGVNTLLSGMHSYASGGTRSVPEGIWISAAGFLLLAAAAFRKRNLGQGAASVK